MPDLVEAARARPFSAALSRVGPAGCARIQAMLSLAQALLLVAAAALAGVATTAPAAHADPIADAWARALVDPTPFASPNPDPAYWSDSTVAATTAFGKDPEDKPEPVPMSKLPRRHKHPMPPWARINTGTSSALGDKFPLNPVVPLGRRGSIDAGQAEYPSVVFVGDTAWMYYSAFGGRHRWEIAAAQSTDGIHWTKLGSVLAPDTLSAVFDSSTVAFPCVLYSPERASEEHFRMWYAGKGGALYEGIGYATSANGRDWVRRGRVLAAGGAGEWDSSQIVDPAVVPVEDGYRMYYCGSRDADGYFQIGLALSQDGVNWVKYPENPIVTFKGNPDGAYTVEALRDSTGYTLFVSLPNAAREFEIFALQSEDGLTFNPTTRQMVLAPSRDGSWDDQMVYGMEALELGDQVYLWFNGIYARNVTKGGEVGIARIGKAELTRLFAGE